MGVTCPPVSRHGCNRTILIGHDLNHSTQETSMVNINSIVEADLGGK